MRFVGIDLAWSSANRSGGAVLSAGGELLCVDGKLGDDDQVLAFLAAAVPAGSPALIAVDAPLVVPNDTGSRPCDRQVAAVFGRFQAGPHSANRTILGRYGGERVWRLAGRLAGLGFRLDPDVGRHAETRQLVEVFPHPATVSLFGLERTYKYKARTGRRCEDRRLELARLRADLAGLAGADPPLHLPPALAALPIAGLRGRAFKEAEDSLDAIVCAYSALYAWHRGPRGYAVYGPSSVLGGPPGDGAAQGHILVPMTEQMWERIKQPRLLFLDRDDTLNRTLDGRPPNRPADVRLCSGIGPVLRHYAAQGWRLIVVTNQGGVAFGYMTEAQALDVHQAVLRALPVRVDASYLCPHHPRGTLPRYAVDCPYRKPGAAAIEDALARYSARPADCLFVGDLDTDRQAAEAAGVPFVWADQFSSSHQP